MPVYKKKAIYLMPSWHTRNNSIKKVKFTCEKPSIFMAVLLLWNFVKLKMIKRVQVRSYNELNQPYNIISIVKHAGNSRFGCEKADQY
ncbi:hypothetical protein THIOSC15_280013 [uncultured Thiomicrorhabdus sp.]